MKLLVCIMFIVLSGLLSAADVTHPNLYLDKKDLVRIRDNIKKYPWAKKIFDALKKEADTRQTDHRKNLRRCTLAALVYAITKDKKYANIARGRITAMSNHWNSPQKHFQWDIGGEAAMVYDLIYDALSEADHKRFDSEIKKGARHAIKYMEAARQTVNMYFLAHTEVGLMGFVTGDEELIEWAMNDKKGGSFEHVGHIQYGGYEQIMTNNYHDNVWHEPNGYGYYIVLPRLIALSEAASRYYKKDYWRKKSANGQSLKGIFDAILDRLYPAENFGKGLSLRMNSFGDTGTQFNAKTSDWGHNEDFFAVNSPGSTAGGLKGFELGHLFEYAYGRSKDPAYAWLIMQNPSRNWVNKHAAYFHLYGYSALSHGGHIDVSNVKAPHAKSRLFQNASFAILRADESPSYWTGKGLTANLMLGAFRSHRNCDEYSMALHAKGRMIYPDIDVMQYENDKKWGWTHRTIAHNSLTVDGANMRRAKYNTRHLFNDAVKIVAVDGGPYQKKAEYRNAKIGDPSYPKNVHLGRGLFLTKEYLFDFNWATSSKEHVYDWALHGMGNLQKDAINYQDAKGLKDSKDLEPYRWIKDVKQMQASTLSSVRWQQVWDNNELITNLSLAGNEKQTIYFGEGPLYRSDLKNNMQEKPKGSPSRLPMIVARQTGKDAFFAALHQPMLIKDNGKATSEKEIKSFTVLARSRDAVLVQIKADSYTDYCMMAFGEDPNITQAKTLPGKKVLELNEKMLFKGDHYNNGEKEKWFADDYETKDWKEISTASTWVRQGFNQWYGYGWYRSHFNLPKKHKGKKLYLHFPGINEMPHVWVNGHFVAKRDGTSHMDDPWTIDVSKYLRFGKENSITIRCSDRFGVGAAYAGGVFRRVSLISDYLEPKPLVKESTSVSLKADGWQVSFTDFAYIRSANGKLSGLGKLDAFQIKESGSFTLNGKKLKLATEKGWLIYKQKGSK